MLHVVQLSMSQSAIVIFCNVGIQLRWMGICCNENDCLQKEMLLLICSNAYFIRFEHFGFKWFVNFYMLKINFDLHADLKILVCNAIHWASFWCRVLSNILINNILKFVYVQYSKNCREQIFKSQIFFKFTNDWLQHIHCGHMTNGQWTELKTGWPDGKREHFFSTSS